MKRITLIQVFALAAIVAVGGSYVAASMVSKRPVLVAASSRGMRDNVRCVSHQTLGIGMILIAALRATIPVRANLPGGVLIPLAKPARTPPDMSFRVALTPNVSLKHGITAIVPKRANLSPQQLVSAAKFWQSVYVHGNRWAHGPIITYSIQLPATGCPHKTESHARWNPGIACRSRPRPAQTILCEMP